MTFLIKDIQFENFRNHGALGLQGLGDLTVLVGSNGVGKTNVLEGIRLLTATSSFRNPQIEKVIGPAADFARVSMTATEGDRVLESRILMRPGKKTFFVNGKERPAADVRGMVPSVCFVPDDLAIAKGSSAVKREALDGLGIQLTRNYHVVCRDYEKTVRYKNRLLKEEAPRALVDAIDETLVTCGSQLFCFRRELFARLLPFLVDEYGAISGGGECFGGAYVPSWEHLSGGAGEPSNRDVSRNEVRDLMYAALGEHGEEERARKRSLVGPHNDKVAFFLDGKDVSDYASQGQQRSIVLAWKLAEVEVIRDSLGKTPVLLLDDVMSELDAERRAMLIRRASEGAQTFITCTDTSPFEDALLSRAQVVELP